MMRVQLDPDTPIYVLTNSDGETEIFQFPYRFTYSDDNEQEVEASINDVEELILFLDQGGTRGPRRTLAEIDAREGVVHQILPRF